MPKDLCSGGALHPAPHGRELDRKPCWKDAASGKVQRKSPAPFAVIVSWLLGSALFGLENVVGTSERTVWRIVPPQSGVAVGNGFDVEELAGVIRRGTFTASILSSNNRGDYKSCGCRRSRVDSATSASLHQIPKSARFVARLIFQVCHASRDDFFPRQLLHIEVQRRRHAQPGLY